MISPATLPSSCEERGACRRAGENKQTLTNASPSRLDAIRFLLPPFGFSFLRFLPHTLTSKVPPRAFIAIESVLLVLLLLLLVVVVAATVAASSPATFARILLASRMPR